MGWRWNLWGGGGTYRVGVEPMGWRWILWGGGGTHRELSWFSQCPGVGVGPIGSSVGVSWDPGVGVEAVGWRWDP